MPTNLGRVEYPGLQQYHSFSGTWNIGTVTTLTGITNAQHIKKYIIQSKEGNPKMHRTPKWIQFATKHLRKPIIHSCK